MSRGSSARWLGAAFVATLAAGIAIGVAIPRVWVAIGPRDPSPAAGYVRDLSQRYDLSAEQVRLVRMVLEDRDRRLSGIDPDSTAGASQVRTANLLAQDRIKIVLNEEQRRRFLRDSEFAAPPSRQPVTDGAGASGGSERSR